MAETRAQALVRETAMREAEAAATSRLDNLETMVQRLDAEMKENIAALFEAIGAIPTMVKNTINEDPIFKLKELEQKGGIKEYYATFDSIRRSVDLPEEFLLNWFIAGLKHDTRTEVRKIRPRSVNQAYGYGLLYEIAYPKGPDVVDSRTPEPSLKQLSSPFQLVPIEESSAPFSSYPISEIQDLSTPFDSSSPLTVTSLVKNQATTSATNAEFQSPIIDGKSSICQIVNTFDIEKIGDDLNSVETKKDEMDWRMDDALATFRNQDEQVCNFSGVLEAKIDAHKLFDKMPELVSRLKRFGYVFDPGGSNHKRKLAEVDELLPLFMPFSLHLEHLTLTIQAFNVKDVLLFSPELLLTRRQGNSIFLRSLITIPRLSSYSGDSKFDYEDISGKMLDELEGHQLKFPRGWGNVLIHSGLLGVACLDINAEYLMKYKTIQWDPGKSSDHRTSSSTVISWKMRIEIPKIRDSLVQFNAFAFMVFLFSGSEGNEVNAEIMKFSLFQWDPGGCFPPK